MPNFQDSEAFDKAFTKTIGFEGGYSNDPNDPGNWTGGQKGSGELRGTKFGISAAQYPNLDIAALTPDEAAQIYWRDYWLPLSLDKVNNDDLAVETFDTSVNQGQSSAAFILQGALTLLGSPVDIDGNVGPQTIGAANAYNHIDALIKLMNVLQGMLYLLGAENIDEVIGMVRKRKGHVKRYIRGWLSRVEL